MPEVLLILSWLQLSMRRHGAKLDKAISENLPLPAPLPVSTTRHTLTKLVCFIVSFSIPFLLLSLTYIVHLFIL